MLLILAGVSISLVVGDNGVLTRASNSSDKTKIGQFKEALQIGMSDVQSAYFNAFATQDTANFDAYVNSETLAAAIEAQNYKLLDGEKNIAKGTHKDTFEEYGDANTTGDTYYVSDGTNGIAVQIKKSEGGTSLLVSYLNDGAANQVVSAVPAS